MIRTIEDWLGKDNQLGIDIWNKKYRNNDETFEEWLDRVSNKKEEVKQLIFDKKFLFGGRILASRGLKDRKITYSNCYVLNPPEDNLESIYNTCAELARTYSYGGGVGIDISKLRPRGAEVNNAAKTTSGAVSFMSTFDKVTSTIGQEGRRGALMISLDIKHPDVYEFVDIKTDLNEITSANISVRVNDAFMRCVMNDEDYLLQWPCDKEADFGDWKSLEYNKLYIVGDHYIKRIKAKDLFDKLCYNNWNYAEPGILYWDRISDYNLMQNTDFQYAGTNPCRPILCRA